LARITVSPHRTFEDIDTHYNDFIEAAEMLGLSRINGTVRPTYGAVIKADKQIKIQAEYNWGDIAVTYIAGNIRRVYSSSSVAKVVGNIETTLRKHGYDIFACANFSETSDCQAIMAAINSKDFTRDMVRVKSSNVWSRKFERKNNKNPNGTLVVQFKNKKGGPGDVYIYFDVPFTVYRRWMSATSVGHFFWVYIRHVYPYAKLTGDKRGKLSHAVNNQIQQQSLLAQPKPEEVNDVDNLNPHDMKQSKTKKKKSRFKPRR